MVALLALGKPGPSKSHRNPPCGCKSSLQPSKPQCDNFGRSSDRHKFPCPALNYFNFFDIEANTKGGGERKRAMNL